MSQTHTPGEWMAVVCTVATDMIEVGDLLIIGKAQPGYGNSDGDGVICIVSPREHVTDEDRANAERIALCCNAHDDLVTALKGCAQVLRESAKQFRSLEDHPGHAGIADRFAQLAEAALAKAGEK